MKMTTRSMAYPAMVLLYTVVSVFLTGCGATVYETVASQSAAFPVSGTVADAGEGEASGSGMPGFMNFRPARVSMMRSVRRAA